LLKFIALRAGFSWWEAWGPAWGVTLVWKVGEPNSRHLKRRGSRCWRHWEGWRMGRGYPSGAVVKLHYIILYEGDVKYGEW